MLQHRLSSIAFVTVLLQAGCGGPASESKKSALERDGAAEAALGDAFVAPIENGGAAGTGGAGPAGTGGAPGTPPAGTGGAQGGATGGAPGSTGGRASGGGTLDAAAPDAGSDAGICASDGDCGAKARFCDVANGRCVACLSDNHCPTGQTCALSDHTCKYACHTSGDCSDPRPYCDTKRQECVECLSDTNCGSGSKTVCDSATRTCVECAADSDCTCLLLGQVPCCTTTHICTCGLLVCL